MVSAIHPTPIFRATDMRRAFRPLLASLSRSAEGFKSSLIHSVTVSRGSAGAQTGARLAAAAGCAALCATAVAADDTLTWGWNAYAQLGDGSEIDSSIPKKIDFFKGKSIKQAKSCGQCNSTAVITTEGELYTFGCGKDSRLGHGTSIDAPNQAIPRLVAGLKGKPVASVAVGEYHMAAVTEDGQVWTFGKNRQGQLGHSDPKPGHPSQVSGLPPVTAVSCGRQHTIALAADGSVYGWGDSTLGAVGSGVKELVKAPVRIPLPEPVIDVSSGRDFSLFLGQSGAVYGCGVDDEGQLGQGFGQSKQLSPVPVSSLTGVKIIRVIAGESHSIALTAEGKVYTWGAGGHGQLGHGDRNNVGLPRKVEALDAVKITGAAAGGAHTLLTSESGEVYAFGRGRNGQLGRGDQVESAAAYRTLPVIVTSLTGKHVTAVSAGENHSIAVAKN